MWLLLVFLGFMLFSSANWIIREFGPVTYEQILFHANMPFVLETKMILSYLQHTVMTAAIIVAVLWVLFTKKYKINFWKIEKVRSFIRSYARWFALIYFCFCCVHAFIKMDVWTMINWRKEKRELSNFYEQNYVLPQETQITFPEEKRNLVIIFMESIESTFAKTPLHDYYNADLIEELHTLADENINFSDNAYLGGAYPIDGTQWTQSALFAKTCGAPIQLPVRAFNSIHMKKGFYPNAWCLYDVLRAHGYKESFLTGGDGNFAGLKDFVTTHGKQKLLDILYYARRQNKKLSYKQRHKYITDQELFARAREELGRLGASEEPFVFTLMTMDTHFGKQAFSDDVCERRYGKDLNLENVVSCASLQISLFVKWLSEQPFYENTVVVMLGDHLMMNNSFTPEMNRHPLNIFINAVYPAAKVKNRVFTPFDIYPTIVESLGAEISGHRLALGTSLFSDVPTLTEGKYSVEQMNAEVRKSSKIYDWLLYGKYVE